LRMQPNRAFVPNSMRWRAGCLGTSQITVHYIVRVFLLCMLTSADRQVVLELLFLHHGASFAARGHVSDASWSLLVREVYFVQRHISYFAGHEALWCHYRFVADTLIRLDSHQRTLLPPTSLGRFDVKLDDSALMPRLPALDECDPHISFDVLWNFAAHHAIHSPSEQQHAHTFLANFARSWRKAKRDVDTHELAERVRGAVFNKQLWSAFQ
jgi:hypothetical protein